MAEARTAIASRPPERTVVYSTDSEHKLTDAAETEAFVDFFRDADLVIFDAMYSLADAMSVKADWGHSSNIVGVELCQMAGARHLCLFHHEPMHDDAGDRPPARGNAAPRGDHTHRRSAAGQRRLRRDGNPLVNGSAAATAPAASSYRRIVAIGVALLIALAALIWLQPRWNTRLQSTWFDTYQLLKPRDVATSPVTVVEIDEASLTRLGQWPWSRTVLAELIRSIARERPAAIGIDILMPEPDRLSPDRLLAQARQADPTLANRLPTLPSSDSELARAIAEAPVVLGLAGTPAATSRQPLAPPFVVVDRVQRDPARASTVVDLPHYAGALTNIDLLDRSATGHGLISAGRSDDVIRRLPLAARIADGFVPSLPIEMLRVALHASAVRLFVDGPVVESIGVGDFVVPTEDDGELRIYYARRDSHRSVSAIDVLDGKVDPLRFDHKLVLIGTTGLAVADYQNTPLGVRMPGSEIQAQVLENLFDQTWLDRPRWAPRLELALFALFGLMLIAVTPRWKARNAALLATACMALPVAAGVRRVFFETAGLRRGRARAGTADPVQLHAAAQPGRGGAAAQAARAGGPGTARAGRLHRRRAGGGEAHPDRLSARVPISCATTPGSSSPRR